MHSVNKPEVHVLRELYEIKYLGNVIRGKGTFRTLAEYDVCGTDVRESK